MPKLVHKVVPILLRRRSELEILAFRHPQAGTQLVKGTLEADEDLEEGALRELAEESGIEDAIIVANMGQITLRGIDQHWHIFLCQVSRPLPDEWSFFTQDGGGHYFAFFWQNLNEAPDNSWHPDFHRALAFVRRQLQEDKATL